MKHHVSSAPVPTHPFTDVYIYIQGICVSINNTCVAATTPVRTLHAEWTPHSSQTGHELHKASDRPV